jgi:hypothetical protein
MSVHKKLQEARVKLQAMPLKKSGHNKFAGYQYFELGDFLPQTQSIFNEIGLCGLVSYGSDLAILIITDIDDGSSVTITSPMSEANLKGCHPVQNLGAVETYQRRYLWVTAMEIVEHDALDSSPPVEKKESSKSVSKDVFDSMPTDEKKFLMDLHAEVMASESMYEAYEAAKKKLDADEQVAFWSLFDSKQRSALKASKQTIIASQA